MNSENYLSLAGLDMELIDMLPGIFVILDENGNISKVGEEFAILTGYSADNLGGKKLSDLAAEKEAKQVNNFIDSILNTGKGKMELNLVNRWGTPLSLFFSGKKIQLDEALCIIIQGFEISATDIYSKGYSHGREEAAGEYEMQIGKIYHRVNNNLAVLSSLFDLKKSEMEDPPTRILLSKTQSRINTFALLHESMYQASKSHRVPVELFISRLTGQISNSFDREDKNIELATDVEPFYLPIEKALPFALLTNEILTNAYEHAFEGRHEGRIEVEIRTRKNRARARLADNGIGMTSFEDKVNSSSMGLKLIRIYLKQLDAKWEVDVKDGVSYEIVFEIL